MASHNPHEQRPPGSAPLVGNPQHPPQAQPGAAQPVLPGQMPPFQPGPGQAGPYPQTQPYSQAQPYVPNQPGQPTARPIVGGQAPAQYPVQGQAYPQGQPYVQSQPLPASQPYAQAPQYPQGQPSAYGQPVAQPQMYPAPQPQVQEPQLAQFQPNPQGFINNPATQAPGTTSQPAAARPVLLQPGTASPVVRDRQQEEPEEAAEELTTVALKRAPPWLVSAVFHMVLMIVLALIVFANLPERTIVLEAQIYAESLGEQLEFDSPLAGNDPDEIQEPVITPDDLPPVDDPFAAPADVDIVLDGVTATSDIDAKNIGLALNGREEGMKRALLGAYGGNALTEAAVQRGLEWLARNQRSNGSWSLGGPYSNGAVDENETAATAMALLAFQGAGNTHNKGKFKANVAKAWEWLLSEQDADGNFFHEGPFNHRFYTQGQCTIALCELYGMSKDEKFREPAERAVQYCLRSQSSEGGWRYSPQSDSDTSVTGWIVMALQSARMAGLEVPEDHFRRVERFLDKVSLNDGTRYCYQRGKEATRVMTAEALLCRQYLGWTRDDPRLLDGMAWITSPANLIRFEKTQRDVYYWYYATQVAHHMEGDYWKRWNSVMRQVIPEQQVKSGREAGSWDPVRPTPDEWEAYGGRLYVTCLSIYMLEVYYRHLPIYSNVYTFIR